MSTIKNVNEKIDQNCVLMVKQEVILKEEADNWGILYDQSTDLSFTINPVGALIWKKLKNGCSIKEIIPQVKETFTNVPPEVEVDVVELIECLVEKKMISLGDRGHL